MSIREPRLLENDLVEMKQEKVVPPARALPLKQKKKSGKKHFDNRLHVGGRAKACEDRKELQRKMKKKGGETKYGGVGKGFQRGRKKEAEMPVALHQLKKELGEGEEGEESLFY